MHTGLPFDDIRALTARLPGGDDETAERVSAAFAARRPATGDLGSLERLAIWDARWTGRLSAVRKPLIAIFAGTHGVGLRDWSNDPISEIGHAVGLWASGGSPVNELCALHDLGLQAFDLALDLPTQDITQGDALDERGCTATMAFGMEAVAGGIDLLCLTDPGIGNEVSSAALLATLLGGTGMDWLPRDADSDAEGRSRRAALVDAALALHGGRLGDPLEALRRVGGRETAAIAGAILAARMERVPVILDGAAALAAAAVLSRLAPSALDHCVLAQKPVSVHLREAADRLSLKPVMDAEIAAAPAVALAMAAVHLRSAAALAPRTARPA
ncbi:MAG: nicotinate-nucleotide--dimethylbenzimidazole phosphoribosyltransferase [Rhizobiaceae bacterium]|nr:nicotinate-nucleotide--dimethylbenzimidazole phosphoribosyltransferase [Rhizobiaceae bacterium]